MKAGLALAALCGSMASAAPLAVRSRQVSDTANDMNAILNEGGTCAPVAVLFARGTFDSG